jgi:hypothetical protein
MFSWIFSASDCGAQLPFSLALASHVFELQIVRRAQLILILIAFITGNSSLEPLIEGLCAQIHVNLR